MQCPYCAEEIQDTASKCKHCGEWIVPQDAPNAERTESVTEVHRISDSEPPRVMAASPKSPRPKLPIVVAIVGVVVILVGAGAWGLDRAREASQAAAAEQAEEDAVQAEANAKQNEQYEFTSQDIRTLAQIVPDAPPYTSVEAQEGSDADYHLYRYDFPTLEMAEAAVNMYNDYLVGEGYKRVVALTDGLWLYRKGSMDVLMGGAPDSDKGVYAVMVVVED